MLLSDGNTSFQQLMKLERLDQDTFQSTAQPFAPAKGHPKSHKVAYGGHVYAQSAWAAAQTVPDGFTLHNISGFFILGGDPEHPYVYEVLRIRDGRSYCTRIVTVRQPSAQAKGACFSCTCSFKTLEANVLDRQTADTPSKLYGEVLAGKTPEQFDEAPAMDMPWYWRLREEQGYNEPCPGLVARKVDMSQYNEDKSALDQKELLFYRPVGDTSGPNLDLCAHLYASDRNLLFIAGNHLGLGEVYTMMGSLVHNVTFHAPAEQMAFFQEKDWFCQEGWVTRIAEGRATIQARLWSASGVHVATVVQDGFIRVAKDAKL